MSLFTLTKYELHELTDEASPGKQIEWLRKNHIPYFLSSRNKIKVCRKTVEQKFGVKSNDDDYVFEPNLVGL